MKLYRSDFVVRDEIDHAQRAEWHALGGIAGDLSTRYTGSAPRGTVTQAGFLSVDGQLRLGLQRSVEVSLGVVNLFDQRPSGWTAAFQRQATIGLRAGLRGR